MPPVGAPPVVSLEEGRHGGGFPNAINRVWEPGLPAREEGGHGGLPLRAPVPNDLVFAHRFLHSLLGCPYDSPV